MIRLNKKQELVVQDICNWYNHSDRQVYEFGGLAGTGKSTIFNIIISELGLDINRVAPMTFIGQAAIVMKLKGMHNARTIHSWLYEPIYVEKYDKHGRIVLSEQYGVPIMEVKFIPRDLSNIDLIIIDEAYTVPLSMKDEIESRGIKILAAGDPGQLPPVKDKPAYLNDLNSIIVLDEVMRQDRGNNILFLADRARKGQYINNGHYGNVLVITDDKLTDDMVANSEVILCGTNTTRDFINNRVRSINGYYGDLPRMGETVVCRKNNWHLEVDGINLTNGLSGKVINDPVTDRFNPKSMQYTMSFKPNMIDISFNNLLCDYNYLIANRENKDLLKQNKFSKGEKFEFGYAITTHMSQGSQYRSGIYIEENMHPGIKKNLNYVGITRFTDSLIYVKKQ